MIKHEHQTRSQNSSVRTRSSPSPDIYPKRTLDIVRYVFLVNPNPELYSLTDDPNSNWKKQIKITHKGIVTYILWLQLSTRRHSSRSQPAPRGFASLQNIAAVLTKTRKQSSLLALKFL